jgi:hypothetical protein
MGASGVLPWFAAMAPSLSASSAAGGDGTPVSVGLQEQLLVDDYMIAETRNVERVPGRIEKANKERKKRGLKPKPLATIPVHQKSDKSWSDTTFKASSSSHKFRDRIVFSGD